ncbi:hypothetical protein KVV02_005210 [Mortierella alpina]|uniref:Phytanoyl-CoA dioxygenase n=1 Tax=Mortierella alpina TaxID=64518 RepID=A0A9P8CUZ1_MORAP|nr:hypothetical protein KVV02_005210 [Mortierella alpina]
MAYVDSPNDIPNLYPPIFHPETHAQEIQEYLATEGYVVVQVTTADEAQARYSEFWTFLENLGSGISRSDPSTWDKASTWPEQTHGILFGYGVGQADFAWKVRTNPNVVKVFADLWSVPETKLLTSFDGANMFPNPRYACNSEGEGEDLAQAMETTTIKISSEEAEDRDVQVSAAVADQAPMVPASVNTGEDKLGLVHTTGRYRMWPHRDQRPSRQGRVCVQGLYNMLPNTSPADGGLVVYPRTHTIDWTERYIKAKTSGDWYVVPTEAPEVDPKNAAVLRTPAGCLLLWDSRLIHCNRPPTAQGRTRAVSYVCMLPRGNTTRSVMAQRQKLYSTSRTTTHWPYPVTVNNEDFSSNKVKPEDVMKRLLKTKPFGLDDPMVRSLVGFNDASLLSLFNRWP